MKFQWSIDTRRLVRTLLIGFAISFSPPVDRAPQADEVITAKQAAAVLANPIVCLESINQLARRNPDAFIVAQQQRDYVDAIVRQMYKDSQALADEMAYHARAHKPYVVDVIGVGAGPQNAIAMASLRAEFPDGKFLILEADDRMGTFDKMKSFDVNTKELPLESGNTFPGLPIQPRNLNPHGAKYVPSTNFADATALAHYYAGTRIAFNHRQIGMEIEPTPGAWPAPYRMRVVHREPNGSLRTTYVYARAELAATGFGEPDARIEDKATQELIRTQERLTEAAMRSPERSTTHAPGIQTVDTMLRIAGDDARAGRSPLARYGSDAFVVVGPRDGGAIAIEAITGLNATLNPTGRVTHNHATWLGQKAKTGQAYKDAIPDQRRVDRYERIGAKIDSKQVMPQTGYLQKIEPTTDTDGKPTFKLTVSERADGSGEQTFLNAPHVVLATGYRNQVMDLFDGPWNAMALSPVVQSPGYFTDNPSHKDQTTIAAQLVTTDKQGNPTHHPIYVVGNAILRTPGGGDISDKESAGAVGGFIDILGPRSAAAGRKLGVELAGGKSSQIPLERLKLSTEKNPTDYFEREYLITKKETLPLLFQNRVATELETKIQLARFLSHYQVPPGKEPIGFRLSKPEGRISLEVQGLSSQSSVRVAEDLKKQPRLIQLLDNLFDFDAKAIEVKIPVRETGAAEPENMTLRVVD